MPGVYDKLATLTGDQQWSRRPPQVRSGLLQQVTNNGRSYHRTGLSCIGATITAIATPGGSSPVQYGLDAQRVPVWLATSCTIERLKLAAAWWSVLSV